MRLTKKIEMMYRQFHKEQLHEPKLKFGSWFDSMFPGKYCWSDVVVWSLDPFAWNPFNISSSSACENESITHEHELCYCGRWEKGKCFELLTPEELAEKEARWNSDEETEFSDLPF